MEPRQAATPISPASRDAVCFTAGARGIPFGAGAIHAHLAADRPAPAVVAGISGGALNAAAMQRCYRELLSGGSGDPDASRWAWYRRYLDLLSLEPTTLIWDGLPDQSDFFADVPPVKDSALSLFGDAEAREVLEQLELAARRELYLYVKIGNWLASLPLTIGRVSNVLVSWVRATERYPLRVLHFAKLAWSSAIALGLLCFHVALNPKWFPEYKFTRSGWKRLGYWRPLFGWRIWTLASAMALLLTGSVAAAIRYVWPEDAFARLADLVWSAMNQPSQIPRNAGQQVARLLEVLGTWAYEHRLGLGLTAGIAAAGYGLMLLQRNAEKGSGDSAYFALSLRRRIHRLTRILRFSAKGKRTPGLLRRLSQWAFSSIEVEKHLVHDFHLRVRLTRLFGDKGGSPVTDSPMPAVLVAALLQSSPVSESGKQLWARPGTPLIDALVATFAVPGLFSPLHVSGSSRRNWLETDSSSPDPAAKFEGEVDLVDGAVIRKNPIPALFGYLLRHPRLAESLTSLEGTARLHVIHSHPTAGTGRSQSRVTDIADVGLKALQLRERRDTELEVAQTNFTSRLEQEIRQCTSTKSPDVRNIFADEISPPCDIVFKNALSPKRDEVLKVVAQGCRRTLERLYANELVRIGGSATEVDCSSLLQLVNTSRRVNGSGGCASGLAEVCLVCSKKLSTPARKRPAVVSRDANLAVRFPFLTGEEPRIIFLASGGVFRGPFHGGMLACLLTTQIRPQMIVGASVGTLMGGALGALLTIPDYDISLTLLGEIVDVFLHVDERIAFTKQFKNAARELGIRGRNIDLSPRRVRKLVKRGTRFDPGFAATGAPAHLIDAISDLTMIPHGQTGKIAADFLAGHVSDAAKSLLDQLKKETLFRLGIRDAVIGSSLLGPTASRLMGGHTGRIELGVQQPFRNIGFFATTTALLEEECRILGRHRFSPNASYDFVHAALASSAFPAVFAPVRESDVFPGTGRADVLFSDGGMFDNLPYLPAISVLGEIQREHSISRGLDPIRFLRQRHSHPDLFVVGSLEIEAEKDESGEGPFNNLIAITKRAKLLENNVKIRAFEECSNRIHKQLDRLLDPKSLYSVPSNRGFIDGVVDAATLAVYPGDADHLNPTFAFCRSTGFKSWRVQKSIADGCFQTFAKLVESMGPVSSISLARAVEGLVQSGRLPKIEWSPHKAETKRGQCPFFRHSTRTKESQQEGVLILDTAPLPFLCPFYEAWQKMAALSGEGRAEQAPSSSLAVFHECILDPSHRRAKQQADERRAESDSIPRTTPTADRSSAAVG